MQQNGSEVDRFRSIMIGERKSPYTVKEYTFLATIFIDFIGKSISQCTAVDVENFKNYLATGKKYSKNSQYLAIKAIKHFFKVMDVPEPRNLTSPKRSKKVPNYLTEREMGLMLNDENQELKTKLIVSILANTGIRVGELCHLNVEDIDLDEGIMHVKSGKGDRDRIVLLPDTTASLTREYLKSRNILDINTPSLLVSRRGNRFDTSTIERIIRNAAQSAGIQKKVTPHVLRHTFATAILRNGGDIRFIQQLLGHASLNTTEIYTHIDESALKEMYEKHRPRY